MEFVKIKEKDDSFILADKDGNTASFEFIDMAVVNGEEYAVLLQTGDDMVTILRFLEKAEDGREHYYTVDDDDVFNTVLEHFKEEFGDEFDFDF